jgi:hypothetical protein
MMAHPLALQLRKLQSLVEIGIDKNTTVVFPAPLMSTIQELGAFLAREQAAVTTPTQAPTTPTQAPTTPTQAPTIPAQAPTTTTPATSTPPAGQAPAPEAAFNTDYNGAPAARPG